MQLAKTAPLLISFYSAERYYEEAANKLREDCVRLKVDHEIVALEEHPGETWIDICRRKVAFYLEMQRKHERPILWLDVDCRLAKRPDILDGATCDVAAFLRGSRYLTSFDPISAPRFFAPFALFFNTTPRATAFLELMAQIERRYTGTATDDFFLQETWSRHQDQLAVMILPPDLIGHQWPLQERQLFYVGLSDRDSELKKQAQQHTAQLFSPSRRKAVLLHEAESALKARDVDGALILYQRALAIAPPDDALANKIARLMRRHQALSDALRFLRGYQGDKPPIDHERRFMIDSCLETSDLEAAEAAARNLTISGTRVDRAWARSRFVRIDLERRARSQELDATQRPPLEWIDGVYPGSFDDLLGAYLLEKLSGLPPRVVSRGSGVLPVGSDLRTAKAGTLVWGSGVWRLTDRLSTGVHYRAVRGPLTRKRVMESTGSCPEVFGDPACFLPRLYRPSSTKKRHKLGFVHHFAMEGEIELDEDIQSISTFCEDFQGIERVLDEINACECVLTTSLHAFIVSHAYGIPARWCSVSSSAAQPGDGTQFHDYMQSVGLDPEWPLALRRGARLTLNSASGFYSLPNQPIDLEALAATAPFKIAAAWQS